MHREALRGILPDVVASRPVKPGFTYSLVHWGHQNKDKIQEILGGSRWLSDRYVAQGEARRLFQSLVSTPPNRRQWRGWHSVRSILTIETWQRAVLRYPRELETLPMHDTNEDFMSNGAKASGTEHGFRYVSPSLTVIGNVRELLAQTPVSGFDCTNGLGPNDPGGC
jgi:hypothetical protein